MKLHLIFFLMLGLLFATSCGSDDEMTPTTTASPIASFQFEVSATDFSSVTFSNFSQNASTYAWDFGDGNSSTDENPVHSYAAGGDYQVTLTASSGSESASSTKTVTIADPDSEIKKLAGDDAANPKVWKLSRDIANEVYPLQVGPEDYSQIWWAFGLNDPVGSRPCLMEEEYIFGLDGAYTYNTNGMIFADFGTWNVDVEGQCIDDSNADLMLGPGGENLLPWGAGTFTYTFDSSAGTLTVNGLGAHIGLAKAGTDAEYPVPQESVTYRVMDLETDGSIDKMTLETSIPGGYWRFNLVSYDNPADEPDLPGAPPTAGFTHELTDNTVVFTNTSSNADSYSWDFGDGNMSTMENPTHTYATDGSYTVTLTASNSNGDATSTANIVVTSAQFSADVLNGTDTKTWKLNPAAGALSVGPFKGSGEWFATTADDVTVRACTFDDEYVFDVNNSFNYVTNGDIWAEAYMGVDPAGCIMDADIPAAAAAWGPGMHTYSITEATATEPAYITVMGTGAFIGLPKAFNGGEYAAAPPAANGMVTYEVLSYVNDGNSEILTITVDISEGQAGGAYWTFTLVAQ